MRSSRRISPPLPPPLSLEGRKEPSVRFYLYRIIQFPSAKLWRRIIYQILLSHGSPFTATDGGTFHGELNKLPPLSPPRRKSIPPPPLPRTVPISCGMNLCSPLIEVEAGGSFYPREGGGGGGNRD